MIKKAQRSNREAGAKQAKAKRPKPSRAGPASIYTEDMEDSEEDPGYSASSQFLAATEAAPKQYNRALTDFTVTVEEHAQSLHESVDERANKIITRDSQLRASFISLSRESQYGILDNDTAVPKQSVESKHIGHTVYQNATSALSSGRGLIAQYQRVSERVAARELGLKKNTNSEKDSRTLQGILTRQGEKAKGVVYRLLHEHDKGIDNHRMGEADHLLWKRFAVTLTEGERRPETDPGQGWAVAAKYAKRAADRMIRNVPEDDDGQRS